MQVAMMEAGLIPNVVDYFDVDTDPSGKFAPQLQTGSLFAVPGRHGAEESGQPYRVRMYSTAACPMICCSWYSIREHGNCWLRALRSLHEHPEVSGSKVDTTKQFLGLYGMDCQIYSGLDVEANTGQISPLMSHDCSTEVRRDCFLTFRFRDSRDPC